MAKELPYFKFEPNQWENGNIQMLSREDKGLFIDLCSMYWSRLGDVPFKLAVQKLCVGDASAFDSLLKESIFEIIDDCICINYLNEQLGEFKDTSKQNSKNAKDGWEKRRKQRDVSDPNAAALIPQSETYTIREDKIKEDKIKVNNIKERKLKFANSLIPFIELYGRDMIKEFYEYWTEPNKSNTKFKQEMLKTWSLDRRLKNWDSNNFGKKSNINTSEPSRDLTLGVLNL